MNKLGGATVDFEGEDLMSATMKKRLKKEKKKKKSGGFQSLGMYLFSYVVLCLFVYDAFVVPFSLSLSLSPSLPLALYLFLFSSLGSIST